MSSGRSRSGGTRTRITSSRYSRSCLKRPASDSARRSRLTALTIRTSTFRLKDSPTRRTSCCCSTRSNFAWARGDEVHHLVEEQRAAVGFLDETRALGDRAREGAAGVAKELRLEEFVRKRRAVEIAEPAFATRAQGVNGTRHELLSHSALALDQDGKRRTRGSCHRTPNLVDRPARRPRARESTWTPPRHPVRPIAANRPESRESPQPVRGRRPSGSAASGRRAIWRTAPRAAAHRDEWALPFRRRRSALPVQSEYRPRESERLRSWRRRIRRSSPPLPDHASDEHSSTRLVCNDSAAKAITFPMASRSFSCSCAIATIAARFRSTTRRGRTAESVAARETTTDRVSKKRRCRRLHSTQVLELAIGLSASSRLSIDIVQEQTHARQSQWHPRVLRRLMQMPHALLDRCEIATRHEHASVC